MEDEKIYEGGTLPEVTIDASRKYISHYDSNGNPVYTTDRRQSMGYNTPEMERDNIKNIEAKSLSQSHYGEDLMKLAQVGIGTPLLLTNPMLGQSISSLTSSAVKDILSHPIRNVTGAVFSNMGHYVDQNNGFTKRFNEKTNNKFHLPNGFLGGLIGYPIGRLEGHGLEFTTREFDSIVPKRYQWHARAFGDILRQPLDVVKGLRNGTYIKDLASLRRAVQQARGAISEGQNFARKQYEDITGTLFPEPNNVVLKSKLESAGAYHPWSGQINMQLSPYNSNIIDKDLLKGIAAHEQTHAYEHWLQRTFGTPSLNKYQGKRWGWFPNKYFVPNPKHPIAKKYSKYFNATLNSHGRDPEETFANYMWFKSNGQSDPKFYIKNTVLEMVPTPSGFVKDYKQYLHDIFNSVE